MTPPSLTVHICYLLLLLLRLCPTHTLAVTPTPTLLTHHPPPTKRRQTDPGHLLCTRPYRPPPRPNHQLPPTLYTRRAAALLQITLWDRQHSSAHNAPIPSALLLFRLPACPPLSPQLFSHATNTSRRITPHRAIQLHGPSYPYSGSRHSYTLPNSFWLHPLERSEHGNAILQRGRRCAAQPVPARIQKVHTAVRPDGLGLQHTHERVAHLATNHHGPAAAVSSACPVDSAVEDTQLHPRSAAKDRTTCWPIATKGRLECRPAHYQLEHWRICAEPW